MIHSGCAIYGNCQHVEPLSGLQLLQVLRQEELDQTQLWLTDPHRLATVTAEIQLLLQILTEMIHSWLFSRKQNMKLRMQPKPKTM